ncbi:hypothetical protein PHLGIDRAFT_70345 [Phlebiopsis gigantea 11061_1 CR5-6]|uniref:N-acetyltransferase domain-containing protein n=1 Tax=Phlebiopsis gigantea (strain 11061_1 CR5-6) TaxID=745531 RepID=A0A0C3NRT0_PHLG1|nr:hypothetical protein PHLGIDRAFT_70345 [Phlebiopsis gigantea 11061_1 CR5-6]
MYDDYDINFHFPVKPLESDRVRLVPFHPKLHGESFFEASFPFPEIWNWVGFGPYASSTDFIAWLETRVRSDRDIVLYAVFNKAGDSAGGDQLAGVIGLLNTSTANLCTEVGFVFTLPPFQRTHVTTHGVGLLLAWCFDELKLRRVQWQTNAENEKSWRAAEKIGFTKEGVIRWQRTLPPGKTHGAVLPGKDDPKPEWGGRHTALLAICWDDWEDGVKAKVAERMARR